MRGKLSLKSYTGERQDLVSLNSPERSTCGSVNTNQCIPSVHREEAQRVWEKREVQWEKERKARERLMHEVNFSWSKTLSKA